MTSRCIKLQTAHNFRSGMPIDFSMSDRGQLVPVTRWDWIKARCATIWNWYTRWWRPRYIVTSIDHKDGYIRIVEQHWSWRKMKWLP